MLFAFIFFMFTLSCTLANPIWIINVHTIYHTIINFPSFLFSILKILRKPSTHHLNKVISEKRQILGFDYYGCQINITTYTMIVFSYISFILFLSVFFIISCYLIHLSFYLFFLFCCSFCLLFFTSFTQKGVH